MTKNTILAVAISVGFLFLWTKYYRPAQIPPSAPTETAAAAKTSEAADGEGGRAKSAKAIAGQSSRKSPAETQKTLVFETEKLRAVFTSDGGSLKSYELKENGGASTADMVAPDSAFFATLPDTPARLTKRGDDVISEQKTSDGTLIKTYRFTPDGLAGFGAAFAPAASNAKGGRITVDMIFSAGVGDDKADAKEIASGNAVKYFDGKKVVRVKSGRSSLDGAGWLAADSRYFILALVPVNERGFAGAKLDVSPKSRATPPVAALSIILVGGDKKTLSSDYRVVAGGKSFTALRAAGLGLEKTLDFGFMGPLGEFFLKALIAINKVTKNYGWAIVILSLGIQAVTLPLSLKSLKATADMRRLQPLMRQIQTKYKDDPKRMNVEVMNLYKTHRVNPLSGCLPMLLQMPIFWALFTTLRNAYELRGAGWILWIKDLSAADPFYVLPVLMGAGMFAQQMMSGATSDPQNKMMGYVFPAVFTFMFLKFPSGVVLYWLINSVLTITIQLFFLEKEIIKEHNDVVVVKHNN